MKKVSLIRIASLVLILLAGGALYAGEITRVTLDVTGMTCRMCSRAVQKGISRVEGVEEVVVSYKDKEAHVKYDMDETDVEEIIKAVDKAGYGASIRIEGP